MARDIETIYGEMLAAFAQERGEAPAEGCDLAVRLRAAAAQIQALEIQADWVLDQSFPQTAQGVYLDYHAQARGLTRAAALPAAGALRFSLETAAATDLPIDQGTTAMTAGGLAFATVEDAVLEAGELSVDVAAQALEAGSGGNVATGAIRLMAVAPSGVQSCTNPQAFTGGRDQEEDESLRQRILDSYRRLPNGANAAYYEQQAMAFEGVAAARAVGKPRGVGSVDVYIASQEGTPEESLRAEVLAWLQERREIAVDLRVLAPTEQTVNVSAQLLPAEGYTFAQAQAAADQAVRNHFTGRLLGRGVTLAELGNLLYSLESVANYHLLSPTADTAAATGKLPVLGTLTLTELEAET